MWCRFIQKGQEIFSDYNYALEVCWILLFFFWSPDEFRIKNKSLILRMQNNGTSINTIRLTKTTHKKSLNKVWVNSFSAKNTTRVRFTVMQTPLQMSVRPQ